ncbi:MAG: efflux RND transporter periplasmic adaptor subunit [Acidobacteria bacterium]|nr:MAG: efflux RND transporter periplasmic adaptor subunit [Acidobacteriota bacterium]
MRIKRWLAFVAIVATGSVFGWSYLRGAAAPQYQTAPVTRGSVDATVAATGTCNAVVTVQVGSQVSGNIKALYADFNTKVSKGQLVALIDPEIFQAKVNQARANLDNARAGLLNAKAVASKSQADIASAAAARENAKAQVAKEQAAWRDADVKLKRRLTLLGQGIMSKEDSDSAQATFDAAAASVQAAQAEVNAAESNVKAAEAQRDVALAQVESMSAQIRQFEAALSQAELDLKHTEIRAPVDGTVTGRRMDVGQTVAASFQAPTIFAIAQDLTKMQVDTNVDEADIGSVRVGQKASFTVDAFPGLTFSAVVSQIREDPINVQNVITYDVVLTVDNQQLKLFPGMTANVRILTDTAKDTLKLPAAAFRFRLPGPRENAGRKQSGYQTIYVLGSDGSPHAVRVSPGLSDGTFTAVSSDGLHENDRVIVGGAAPASGRTQTQGPRGPAF